MAWKVAMTDYEPKSAKAREALDLPLLDTAEIFPVHHRVCAVKHRPATAHKPHHRDLFAWPVADLANAMRRMTTQTTN